MGKHLDLNLERGLGKDAFPRGLLGKIVLDYIRLVVYPRGLKVATEGLTDGTNASE